jgi:hypothetical protein
VVDEHPILVLPLLDRHCHRRFSFPFSCSLLEQVYQRHLEGLRDLFKDRQRG